MLGLLNRKGYVEIQEGVYLHDAEHLKIKQETWSNEDVHKNYDFSEYPYYITDESGSEPSGVESIEDGIMTILGIETLRKFLGE